MGEEICMKWRKLGRVFCPSGEHPWMKSHAANPFALPRDGNRLRILFSCRDTVQRSAIGYVEVDMANPTRVLEVSREPVLLPGDIGEFDDCGTTMGCVIQDEEGVNRLYYLGWNLGRPAPWRNSIGLAHLREDDRRAVRHSPAPVLDRGHHDPLSLSYPWVSREPCGWRMWYGSHLSWGDNPPESMIHVLKYAESSDGLTWRRDNRVVLGGEWLDSTSASPARLDHAFARPCVLSDGGVYRMWYSYRGRSYRIGYATSGDGLTWQRRDDEVGLDVSCSGWDSEMLGYSHVFDHHGARYMLYCGNGYGKTGFGMAVLEQA
jgi:hypothetical protein